MIDSSNIFFENSKSYHWRNQNGRQRCRVSSQYDENFQIMVYQQDYFIILWYKISKILKIFVKKLKIKNFGSWLAQMMISKKAFLIRFFINPILIMLKLFISGLIRFLSKIFNDFFIEQKIDFPTKIFKNHFQFRIFSRSFLFQELNVGKDNENLPWTRGKRTVQRPSNDASK